MNKKAPSPELQGLVAIPSWFFPNVVNWYTSIAVTFQRPDGTMSVEEVPSINLGATFEPESPWEIKHRAEAQKAYERRQRWIRLRWRIDRFREWLARKIWPYIEDEDDYD